MNEWISVEDGLPKLWESVLLYWYGGVQYGSLCKYGETLYWEIVYVGSIHFTEVTHWQPLPDPPKVAQNKK